jgi:hypothetical protein
MTTDTSPEAVKRRLWVDYQYAHKERFNVMLDDMQKFVSSLRDSSTDVKKLLQKAADTIHERLRIRDVTIGLRSSSDGLYRYEVMAGLKGETWAAHKELAYTKDQFYDPVTYKPKQISKYTRLFLSEDNPYANGEERTYDRPVMLQSKRRALDDSIEGDYLDIDILGVNDDHLGWIEISGTLTNKLPDVTTIKYIELMACTIGVALSSTDSRQGARGARTSLT